MWKSIASNALTLLIVMLIAAAALVAWGRNEFVKVGPLETAICLRVEPGASLSAVSRNLEERGAVSDARIFRIGADYSDRSDKLKFGSYLVKQGASMEEVLQQITAGGASSCGKEVNFRIGVASHEVVLRELDPETQRFVEVVKFDPAAEAPAEYTAAVAEADLRYNVIVVEGATSWQVVDGLRKVPFLEGEIAAVPAEGSLAPKAYDVVKGSKREDLLAKMVTDQAAVMAELWPQRAADLPYDTPEEAMVMASIIEKETGIASERADVAAVFVNRLNQGMRLQTDPTVIYGITKGEGVLGRGLRQSELRRETPYNTYVISGLPPGPIANPGREAIAAALNPSDSNYIFFVAKTLNPADGHVFAVTLDEHNRNVEAFRALERAAAAE
ncbi:endolytic transglycosylase MltG [Xinfangfangia sp. CPCC 101601]|uniref:Endolytic murein transglycosylase n=1 Tax=Pseudogemmobacter lacusdianii TaxID=3069608 RepID=A0ABU0W113_9RHOB|nr:endolytic transglycosylase MltG [Xinfangfangia sp. CPCC 101601]MDQ2067707.1 endolytic transglycosylase MltG [Xinfangfangia sp. CPCC 101601]